MVFTPTDPAQAEVRVTQDGAEIGFDFYIPRGSKGEPGGFTYGTELGSVDLDSIKVGGMYRQINAGNTSGLLNYPVNKSGVLEVIERIAGSHIFQRYTITDGTNAARVQYVRTYTAPNWGPWSAFASSRVDQTAGRAIYEWDAVNNRDQLVWGDTGLRDIKAELASGSANVASLRREGSTVYFRLVTWAKDAAGIGNETIYSLPNGFRPDATLFSLPGVVRGAATLCQFDVGSAGSIVQQTPLSTASIQFSASWLTNNAWPTSLPGVAVGSIPNL